MDDPKYRGKQHLKNKAKYKGKSKAFTQVPTKSPALISNWDRYQEELPSTSDTKSTRGADFSVLAEAPISKGSHFQFKSDAPNRFDVDNTSVDTNGLFNIDLNLLGLSLASIPFNERCGIPENYFEDTQLNIMKKSARDSAILYQHSLQNDKLKVSAKLKDRDDVLTRKERSSEDETDHFKMNNKSLSSDGKLLSIILANAQADEYDPEYRDRFMKEGINNIANDKNYDPIDKLNELEEELDKLELMKNNSKAFDANILNSNEYKGISSPIQASEFSKSSVDTVDHCSDNLRGKATVSGTSLLETESLQQWLDDVLGD